MDFSPAVRNMSAKNFKNGNIRTLAPYKGQWTAILFYAPWCPACKAMHEEWSKLADACAFARIGAFNCDSPVPDDKRFIQSSRDMCSFPPHFPTMGVYNEFGEMVSTIGNGSRAVNVLMGELMKVRDGKLVGPIGDCE